MLPLFLDMRGRKVVVFGGGEVGYRKAAYFSKEADVTVVSLTFISSFNDGPFVLVKEDIHVSFTKWVDHADLVVAATDSVALNSKIEDECERMGKWCNNALGVSDFLIPSVVERDGYTVCVSTLGRSPAMSRFLKFKLEESLTPEYSAMVRLQEDLRAVAKERISDQSKREKYLWDVLHDDDVWDAMRSGDLGRAWKIAMDRMV